MNADPDTLCGLDPNTLEARIRSLARDGYWLHEIASITRLHPDVVRRILQTTAADNTQEATTC
jgi:hypothetical protein